MSRDMHPTRGTRIPPKGLQSPLEAADPTGRQGLIKLHLQVQYALLPSYSIYSSSTGERPSTECVEVEFSEVDLLG
jgi:hypothetical protein